MRKIVQVGHNTLREQATPVPVADIKTPAIQNIIRDMFDALHKEVDGAALAAPQVGVPLRIFVLSERVFGEASNHEAASKDPHFVYINPVIIKRSKRTHTVDEGCLSVRGKYGTIDRATHVTIEAYDEHGKKFTRGAGGLLAQAFQHETDHLDGVLFTDSANSVWDVEPPTQEDA